MLNFIYYPVSAIMWFWHKAFGYVFGEASGIAWALSVVFLVFTLRALLYKPFVHQVRSMRKMQEFPLVFTGDRDAVTYAASLPERVLGGGVWLYRLAVRQRGSTG